MRSVNPNTSTPTTVTITVATNATGDGDVVAVVEGAVCSVTPAGSATPTATAASLATLINAVSGVSASAASGVITVSADNGTKLHLWAASSDSTQTITATGGAYSESLLSLATAAATGRPSGPSGGYAIDGATDTVDAGARTLLIRPVLLNTSGASRTAYWRIWFWSPGMGWQVDPTVAVRSITDAGSSSGFATDDPVAVSCYGSRVAVELVGSTSTGTNLSSGAAMLAWVSVV
jgi:hypothetical protein